MIGYIDDKVYQLIAEFINLNNTNIMLIISHLGSAITLIVLTITFCIVLKNKKDSAYIILNLATVFVLNRILKWIIGRPRPNVLMLVPEDGYSFPSGHSMVSMGFYGFLIYLTYKNISNKKIKYSIVAFLSLLIVFIGISRIYLGVHYATDVIGGFIIGAIYLAIFIKYIYNRYNGKEERNNNG